MTVYLPPELVGQLTAMTMYDGREVSEVIEDAVRSYVVRS
jgi:metal-responsive CopG/Arc/MetJ family transcriptional regulator